MKCRVCEDKGWIMLTEPVYDKAGNGIYSKVECCCEIFADNPEASLEFIDSLKESTQKANPNPWDEHEIIDGKLELKTQ